MGQTWRYFWGDGRRVTGVTDFLYHPVAPLLKIKVLCLLWCPLACEDSAGLRLAVPRGAGNAP